MRAGPGQPPPHGPGRAVRRHRPLAPDAAAGPAGGADRALACADVRSLPLRSGSCAGVVAFYVLQHLPRADLGAGLHEIHRVLAANGTLTSPRTSSRAR